MAPNDEFTVAMINRSIRTIKAELEFLADASAITPQILSDIVQRLPEPEPTALRAPVTAAATVVPLVSPLAAVSLNNSQPEVQEQHNEKNGYYQPQNNAAPPPAYGAAAAAPPQPSFPPLCQATALYAYSSADKGDLQLEPNDGIEVTEYLNAEWWKGRSKRTGLEGIFPRSYVRVNDMPPPPAASGAGPSHGLAQDGKENKLNATGKKIGGKFGNAVVFGAGASVGANLVNSIF